MIYYKRYENEFVAEHYCSDHNIYNTNSPYYIYNIFRRSNEKDIKESIEMLKYRKMRGMGGLTDETSIEKGINSKGEESIYIFNSNLDGDKININLDGEPEFYDQLDELETSGGSVVKVNKQQLIKILKTWFELPSTKNEYALLWDDEKNNIFLEGILDKTSLIKRIKEVKKLERQCDPKDDIPIPILEEEN